MPALAERLRSGRVLLADGAIGTMLMERGLKKGHCPESMILDNPDLVENITRLYIGAGAEMVQTNTFGASPLKLAAYDLENKTEEINRRAVEIARSAARTHALIVASVGPSGRLLKPHGDLEPSMLARSYHRQLTSLARAGVDGFHFETMMDLTEALTGIKTARAIAPDLPVLVSLVFDQTPRGFFTIMGVSIEKAVSELTEAGADVLGANCGSDSRLMLEIAKKFKSLTNRPIIIRPNAGLPVLQGEKTIYPETPEYFADHGCELARIGVAIIGGCCGTTPAHIRALARALGI